MKTLITPEIPKDILKDYFNLLKDTGYVEKATMSKIMTYFFLIEWLNDVAVFVTNEDYRYLHAALRSLFICGNCLFEYPVFSLLRTQLGSPEYKGPMKHRKSEDEVMRISEVERIRLMEDQ